MADLIGKVTLITGASSGIGRATAIHFASLGSRLALCDRDEPNLHETMSLCKEAGDVITIVGDLTIESDVVRIIENTIEHYKQLDVLINNAGVAKFGGIMVETLEHFDTMMATNVRAVFQLTKLAVPHLIESKGAIVNVSSILAMTPNPLGLAYGMSKAALNIFTRSLALDLAPKQVRVNSVNPGIIETNMFAKRMPKEQVPDFLKRAACVFPIGRVGQPEEVAKAIAFLASSESSFTTGTHLELDGGSHLNVKVITE